MVIGFDYGLNAPAKKFDGINKYLRITDIDDASRCFIKKDLTSPDTNLEGKESYQLDCGDIVFARTGASVGKTYIYQEDDGLVYFAGFLIRARFKNAITANFVFQYSLTEAFSSFVRITSQRSGQPGINSQEYGEFSLCVPSIEEQKRISSLLTNIDKLITLQQL